MIPVSQIIQNVRTKFEARSTVRWSDGAILAAINEGLDDLSEITRFYERHVSVPLAAGATYYDLRGWLPESALGVTSVWCSLTETWLEPRMVKELGSRWEQAVGSPLNFFMRGFYFMGVCPKPETATGFLRVYFAAHAPHFTYPQAVLMDLLDDMEVALEDYALYELAAQDGETNEAIFHFSNYSARAKKFENFVDRRIVKAETMKMGSR